jgi:hypothetical protein
MRRSVRIAILIVVWIILGSRTSPGQQQLIQKPLLGFVYDKDAGEVRAILGVPGALVFSDPLALPAEVRNVHFAPGQKYAIVERSGGAPVSLLRFPGVNPGEVTEIPSSIVEPSIVSFSPGGGSVAVYSSSEGLLEIIAGLPDTPRLLRDSTRDDLPGDVKLLAVSDGGTALEGTVNGEVYRLPLGAAAEFVFNVTDLGGLTFAPSSDDALLFDHDGGRAILLQNVTGAVSHRLLAGELNELDGPIILHLNGGTARITSAASSHLWQIDLRTLQVQDLSLPGAPAMLKQLRASGKFLLSSESGQPAWILDTTGLMGSFYFVPAVPSSESNTSR